MRLIQHKKEAYWFYRFLSVFYDKYVNPLFWTEQMRDQSLEIGNLNDRGLKVIDVGSGTGFTTQGIAKFIPVENITCLDQSPHQMNKAKQKADLQGCTFVLGDAENIPFPDNNFDRYVSAGSIEYWPNPQQGINESFRVIKPGGVALMIGPLEPGNSVGRFIAGVWMLFPTNDQYETWYKNSGFTEIKIKYIRPQWFKGKKEYGIAISGVKPMHVAPANIRSNEIESEKKSFFRPLQIFWRVVIGSLAGFIFIPVALAGYLRNTFGRNKNIPAQYKERLNGYQLTALIVILILIIFIIWLIVN
ncbi:MAG: methyltransferase domain-containing protein [Chitinophagales bacterium]